MDDRKNLLSLPKVDIEKLKRQTITYGVIVEGLTKLSEGFPDVETFVRQLYDDAYVIILRGGLNSDDPRNYMNAAVNALVGNYLHNEFIEAPLDNPWVRIITLNFQSIPLV